MKQSGKTTPKQSHKGSGDLSWGSNREGVNATYFPVPGKTVHGFFHIAALNGAKFDPGLKSVLKFHVKLFPGNTEQIATLIPFILFLVPGGSNVRDGHRLKFFAGSEPSRISFMIPNTVLKNGVDIHLRVPAQLQGGMHISRFRLLAGIDGKPVQRVPSLFSDSFDDYPLCLETTWEQKGRRLSLTCLNETVFFDMPATWSMDTVTSNQRELVDDFLFGGLRAEIFGIKRFLEQNLPLDRRDAGADGKTVLSFSTGEDSTAAMAVLPENTSRYFCRRPYAKFFTSSGKTVHLKRRHAEEYALSLLPDSIIIDTDMELLVTRFGGKLGNPTTASVACVGVLLANFLGVTSVSIGAQLETSYLKDGRAFTDVYAIKSSVFWKRKRLFNYAGLDICYPVGALSEVLTNRVVAAVSDRFFSVPCPHTDADLNPCARCYKCFRKMQLSGESLKELDSKTMKILDKEPLKMATSAIYAARKGGFKHHTFDKYQNLDLSFLERYYDRAVETLVPSGLREYIRRRFHELGFEPMTTGDEYKLRTIAMHIAPELYSRQKAFPSVNERTLFKEKP